MASGTARQDASADAAALRQFEPADYKEWRERTRIYYRKMGLTKRNGEIGSLQGSAWGLVEDFSLDDCEKTSAVDSMIKLLDGHFEHDT